VDNNPVTRWVCGPTVEEQTPEIDLGNETTVGAVVMASAVITIGFRPR
jgi:hypothetical protein